jgi:hypothetical protein
VCNARKIKQSSVHHQVSQSLLVAASGGQSPWRGTCVRVSVLTFVNYESLILQSSYTQVLCAHDDVLQSTHADTNRDGSYAISLICMNCTLPIIDPWCEAGVRT